ncbi:MAG: hypothetical protein LLG05_05270 [Porphyromonadaceae bacterium]|nr:hypothetical protein [Porphyromonadaceae bacterium]
METTKAFIQLTNEAINKLARAYAKDHSNAPDKDCPDWIIHDYEAGAYAIREILTGFLILTEEGLKKHLANLRPVGREGINWKQIHDDFIAWDTEGKFEFSQKQIFEWFKEKITTELTEVRESGQSNVSDEEITN